MSGTYCPVCNCNFIVRLVCYCLSRYISTGMLDNVVQADEEVVLFAYDGDGNDLLFLRRYGILVISITY